MRRAETALCAAGTILHPQPPRGPCPCSGRCWGAVGGLAELSRSVWTFSAMGQYHEAFAGGCRNPCASSAKGKKSFTNCTHICEFIHRVAFAFHPPPEPCAHCWHSLPIPYNNSQVSTSHCLPVEPMVTALPGRSHE